MNIVTVSNPVYANTDGTHINCDVVFSEKGVELPSMPYTASSQDFEPYGMVLWDNLITGQYGSISPYVDPVVGYKDNLATMSQEAIAEAKRAEATIKYQDILERPVTVNGEGFWVDRDSIADMSGIVTEKMSNGLYYVDWFFQGIPRRYTVQQFQPLYNTVKGYQQKVFSQFAELLRAIDTAVEDGTDVSLIDVDAGVNDGWPSDTIV